MSLDFYLHAVRETTVFDANITHNLGKMAEAAGIYKCLWHPAESGFARAEQIIPILEEGIRLMEVDPAKYEALNAENGWGTYANFLPWCKAVLAACKENPDAIPSASR